MRIGRFLLLITGPLLSVAISVSDVRAQSEGPGWAEFERGDYQEAVSVWRRLAEQGDAKAQETLGWAYEDGRALPRDLEKSVAWYSKAAVQGRTLAQSKMGQFYWSGGWGGVPQNFSEARSWFLKAAKAGDLQALRSLARMAREGNGEPISRIEAYKWYDLATRSNESQISLLNQKNERDDFGRSESMTAEETAEAKRRAAAWERDNWPARWPPRWNSSPSSGDTLMEAQARLTLKVWSDACLDHYYDPAAIEAFAKSRRLAPNPTYARRILNGKTGKTWDANIGSDAQVVLVLYGNGACMVAARRTATNIIVDGFESLVDGMASRVAAIERVKDGTDLTNGLDLKSTVFGLCRERRDRSDHQWEIMGQTSQSDRVEWQAILVVSPLRDAHCGSVHTDPVPHK